MRTWIRQRLPADWLVLLITAVACLSVTLIFWQALKISEERQIDETTRVESELVTGHISSELENHLMVLARISDRWEFAGRPTENVWAHTAELNLKDFPGFRSIQWMDQTYQVRWVTPDEIREDSVVLDHTAVPERQDALNRARQLDTQVASPPLNLIQGDRGFVVYQPVYLNPNPNVPDFFNHEDRFDGLIIGTFAFDELFDLVLDNPTFDGYGIAVLTENEELVVVADDADETHNQQRRAEESLTVAGQEWQVRVWPSEAGLAQQHSALPRIALIGGLLGTGLILSLIHLLQASRQRTAEARALNLELTKATMALESSNQSLEEFAYIASHDLKSPLVTMQGLADIMQEDYGDVIPDEAQTYLSRIQVNARRMQNLLDGVLRVSGMHHADEAFTNVRLADTVETAREQLAQLISERGATVRVVDRLPVVHGNPTWLQQIVLNLIENAITYAHQDRQPVIEIGCRERDNVWEVYVRDNGPGIPAHYSNRLFAMFQRLPDSNVANPAGTGMGLAIVARSVKAHGGEVWIDESSDSGTSFAFTIPRSPVAEPADAGSNH